MELQGLCSSAHPFSNHFGSEKDQMLNLNQRLESYLTRVKLLDKENAKLVQEIQALRRNHHSTLERRKFLDEELRNARLEVDLMWKERVYAEVDVARMTEELQSLGHQLQRETQAKAEAKAKVDQSRRELEEEHRAQIWLKEKVNQLEHEMKSLIQSHQEEVDHMEAMLMQPRVMRPAIVQHGPNLLDLGQEYNQRVTRAWQEAAQAYQGQLSRLEESVNETKQKLVQVNKEKSESVLKLQNLDRELLGLQDLKEHLESTVDQQTEGYCRDIQMLQEHLEDLEREKFALTQKMDQLLQENRGLVQMKKSLSMEVATYRALLDNESHKGDISLQKQPRNIYSREAVFNPWGVKDNYQMYSGSKITSSSFVHSMTGKAKPQTIMVTPTLHQKNAPKKEILEISKENVEDKMVQQELDFTPYPKVLKNGVVESFRPQEVQEKVTYAEPLSPPEEQEVLRTLEERTGDFWNDIADQPQEDIRPSESEVSCQVQPSLNREVPLEETCQKLVEPALIEETCSFSMKSEPLNVQEHFEDSQTTIDVRFEEECATKTKQPFVESNLSHQIESQPNTVESINYANPEIGREPYTGDSCTVGLKSKKQDIYFENDEIEKPQAPTEAWVGMEHVGKTEQLCKESNLRDQDESVPNINKSIIEANPQFVREPFTNESCTAALKSEMEVSPLANEEKPQAPIKAWAEDIITHLDPSLQSESVLNFEESTNGANPELVEEPFTEDSCNVADKPEMQDKHLTNEEKPQTPVEAWAEETRIEPNLSHQLELIQNNTDAVKSEVPSEIDEITEPQVPTGICTEKEFTEDTKDQEQQESSDSETAAFVEPNFDTKSSSPASEESLRNQSGNIVKEDFTFDSVVVSRDDFSPPKEKLYPDGEEMDTWDSVMEQNPDVKDKNAEESEDTPRQHAEPEEDISAKEAQQQQHQQHGMFQDEDIEVKMEPQPDLEEQNNLVEEDLQDKSQDDELEDSQNVSVSWRTELEGDSYGQDNTLADTRPLIRYKSDDTDANTQASHVDDVDNSSDSEQDRKVGEMVSGTWTEDKTRKFGTMEDLCEEAEGEVLDEEYDVEEAEEEVLDDEYYLEYLRKDGKDDVKDNKKEKCDDSQEEEIKTVVEEELDTDKLVEQELENLTTECYTTQFAQHQVTAKDLWEQERFNDQPRAWKEALEDMPETLDMEDFLISDAQTEEKGDDLFEVTQIHKEETEELEENEGETNNISMVTHSDPTEDNTEVRNDHLQSSASEELSLKNESMEQKDSTPCDNTEAITKVRKEVVLSSTSQELAFDYAFTEQKEQQNMEEKQLIAQDLPSSHDTQSVVDLLNDDINQSDKAISSEMSPDNRIEIRDTSSEETLGPKEVNTEFSNVSLTTEWKVDNDNPMEEVSCDENKTVSILPQCLDNVNRDSLSPTDAPLNSSPQSGHEDVDLFIVKDSKALLKTNGKANLDDMYSSGGSDDFWMSPLETGATYQPDDVNTKHTEWKLEFGDIESRGSENVSKSDIGFEQKEVTQYKSVVKGEIVHSEESEDDSEAMSSGEE